MAILHPAIPNVVRTDSGRFRELDVLDRLQQSLPDGYELFHQLDWHSIQEGRDRHGELDIVILAPNGNLLILEVKAGGVILRNGEIFKLYASSEHDVGRQCRVQYAAMVNRLKEAGLHPYLSNCLVLPDYRVGNTSILAFPRDRIIDADSYDQLGRLAREFLASGQGTANVTDMRLFLKSEFRVTSDLNVLRDQVNAASHRLADGLATWGTRITSPSGVIRVQATAGSGKTQMAVRLMEDAAQAGLSTLYTCYNRPLSDHIAQLAPTRAHVTTYHELGVEHFRRQHNEPDFTQPGIFSEIANAYLADSVAFEPRYDLLIIDEGQDFEAAWVECLLALLKPDGRLYLFEDDDQRLYERDPFELDNAVTLTCRDNFRTPKAICEAINAFGLPIHSITGRNPYTGQIPNFHIYANPADLMRKIAKIIEQKLEQGFRVEDVVVLSSHGRSKSALLNAETIGSYSTRRFTGNYTRDGEPVWTTGDLLVESVYRFKGQSAPVVILAEIDFAEITPLERRKLFVGMTRGQMQVDLVMSAQAEAELSKLFAG